MKSFIKRKLLDWNIFYLIKDRTFYKNSQNQAQRLFYSSVLDPNSLIFDVGANLGQRSKIFSDLGSKVISIEPQPYCINHLRSRFNNVNNVVIVDSAMGSASGEATMYLSSSHTLSSLSKEFIETHGKHIFKNDVWNDEIKVSVLTLDDLISRYGIPDFIKIDVEGFELTVLKGLSKAISSISFEFIPGDSTKIIDCLTTLNCLSEHYRYNFTQGENLDLQLSENMTYEDFSKYILNDMTGTFGDIYAFLQTTG